MKKLTEDNIKKMLFGEPVEHDHNSCNALKEYEQYCKGYEDRGLKPINPAGKIKECANKWHTTIDEMKKHWRCIDDQARD